MKPHYRKLIGMKAESYDPNEGTRYHPRKTTKYSGDRQPPRKIIQNNDSEDDPRS